MSTPTDTDNDTTSTDTSDDTSSSERVGSRTRTRTRSTSRSGSSRGGSSSKGDDSSGGRAKDEDRAKNEDRARDEDKGDDEGGQEDAKDSSSQGSSDGSGRRRRRGARGGRGRSRSQSGGGRSEDDGDDEASTSSDKGSSNAGGKAKEASKDTSDSDDGKSKADRETEAAIAKGGTRMAAKRRGRGSSGGGGGGGGGRRRHDPGGVPEEVRRAILDGPPRTMLVTHQNDRTQIVVMEDRRAVEHYVTHAGDVTYVGNIYMARVQNVLPGMEAAFLDIGKGRNGVLYAGEVIYDEDDVEDAAPRIEDTLKPGQKVLVQVTKDPMGTKGPRLTQHLSLAGRYSVLAPNSDLFGISRKLTDKERDRLRRIVKKAKPSEHGIIVRTAAENASEEAVIADIERLLAKWAKVEEAAKDAKAMTAVYEEPQLVVKVIRDNFGPEFERCIVDDKQLYEEVREYLSEVAPDLLDKVELHEPKVDEDEEPRTLFGAYNVAEQLRKATERKVWLPSGGYLIIEATEAMKVIDVNTGKFTGSKDTSLEEVVLKTNLEAADEIVRQLRLRDMGGIIIIDFIDMLLKANQDQVIRRLKRELLRDRTKTRVSEVSRLGLVQMTRKNVSQGLVESFSTKCETCNGLGRIVDLPE